MSIDFNFQGRRALVTGASRGIGFDIVLSLARCGADVIGLARSIDSLKTVKEENPKWHITAVACDLSDWKTTRDCVSQLGTIDLLVNNAGVGHLESFLELKQDNFDKVFDVNVKAAINVSQVVAQSMVSRGKGGSIVHVSSQASQRALDGHTVYCMSKAALDSLCRSMALELGAHNIRVNCVNPTVVLTELGMSAWSEEAKAGPMRARIPMGKFAEIEDVVSGVLFLLSDHSVMTTGATFPIDGGMWAA